MINLPDAFNEAVAKALESGKLPNWTSVNLLDVTLRDGGFAVEFDWSRDFIKTFVSECVKSGTRKVEIGYLGGVNSKSGWYKGISADIPSDFIAELIEDIPNLEAIAIINPWRVKSSVALKDYKKSGLSLLRVAYNPANASSSWNIIQQAVNENINVGLNVTSVSRHTNSSLLSIVEESKRQGVTSISFADTTSSLLPKQIEEFRPALNLARELGIGLGFHGHDVLGFGNANALAFINHGINTVDVSIGGVGRGGKNLVAELWKFMKVSEILKQTDESLISLANLSKLIGDRFHQNYADFIGLTCAIFGISPEIVEGLSPLPQNIQHEANLQCSQLIYSHLKQIIKAYD
ncbi:beta/alpha barrel domain-containing protein [Spirosoma profusum]|nr:hypothetical protein [Spirosoma profusum]